MPQQVADRKDQDFVIWEQLNCEEILKHEIFHEFNKKTCNMIITEARALAVNELLPLLAEGDEQGVRLDAGIVKVPESFHRVYKLIQQGEWNNLGVPQEMGGAGSPGLRCRSRCRVLFRRQLGPVLLYHHGKRHRSHYQFVRYS